MVESSNIRNFCIIAHIDHGKSTLADRFLELTGTVEKRKMQEQFLDQMELERERGITIKLQPVRMKYAPQINADDTQTDAENQFLYGDITYKIRGAVFEVKKRLGLGHKENIYRNALVQEFSAKGLQFETEKRIDIFYDGKKIGNYQPDFIIENKIIVELKALPELGRPQIEQLWSYLKGSVYKLALLVNFGDKDLEIKRVVYDSARFLRTSAFSLRESAQIEHFVLNLIDTPGHVDFTYEVSRSLAAVEGAVLLVDASKGIQAQTLANLHLAQAQNLTIIPVVNKIDLPNARTAEVKEELSHVLGVAPDEIIEVSAKNGTNVEKVLEKIIEKILPPKNDGAAALRALIFDSVFDAYKGVIAFVRIFDGSIKKGDKIAAAAIGAKAEVLETGFFAPALTASLELSAGEIGYIATGLKDPSRIKVGDTITAEPITGTFKPLSGYKEPKPMVFASFFPENSEDYDLLKDALGKLKLTDASLSYEPESSVGLGRGFRLGFLGMLHVEIISERLKREFGLSLIISSPSVEYFLKLKNGQELKIRSAALLPDPAGIESIAEPFVSMEILTPAAFVGNVMELASSVRSIYKATEYLGKETALLKYEMPLSEIITDFYDKLKSVSSGYASMSYEFSDFRKDDLVRLDILIAGETVEPFSKIIHRKNAYHEGRAMVVKLKETVPPQWFEVAIQAAIGGKIIARESIRARRKDVTGYLYGGDVTRKMKLLEKQKRGKKKMKAGGRVVLPQEVFLKMLKR